MKLFIATNSNDKLFEFREIFNKYGLDIEIVSPSSFNDHSEPNENGSSFEENAIIKAKFYFDKYHLPTIADDSGLCIEFLNGFPGIYSARFMRNYSYKDKNDTLIKVMDNAPNRNATFNCVVAYIDRNANIHTFEGINKGMIAHEQKGEQGFGYDPIFYIPELNKTEAELGNDYKNTNSHRYLATKKFIQYLKDNE